MGILVYGRVCSVCPKSFLHKCLYTRPNVPADTLRATLPRHLRIFQQAQEKYLKKNSETPQNTYTARIFGQISNTRIHRIIHIPMYGNIPYM